MDENKDTKSTLKNLLEGIGNIVLVFVFVYLIILIGQLVWKNYQINRRLTNLQQTIEIGEIQNELMTELLNYYQSDNYKEIELRRRMMLQKPGEKVLLLKVRKDDKPFMEISEMMPELTVINDSTDTLVPNYKKWWDLFFEKK